MDRIEHLRTFSRVVEQGGFAAAARVMGRSRAVVNRQVIELEKALGVQLLTRSTRSVTPTEAGRLFYERAKAVLDAYEEAIDAVSDRAARLRGNLRVNAPMTFGVQHLALHIAQFMRAHPELHVELVLNDRQIDPIEEGFDLTIRIGEIPASTSLTSREISRSQRLLCASPDYLHSAPPIDGPADLRRHRCLHYGYQSSGNRWRLGGPDGDTSWPVHCVLWSNNGEVLKTAALAHQGIALLPAFIVGDALHTGELVTVLPEHAPAPVRIFALYARHRLLAARVSLLLNWLEDRLGGRPSWDLVD